MNHRTRIIGYDYIRIISIFMVVVIHGNVAFLSNAANSFMRVVVMEITALCLVSVPAFFMISGALLLKENCASPLQETKKRIFKQGTPFILWSIVYVLARIIMKKIPFGITAFISLIKEPAYYQFWFMYSLLAIYILLPPLIILTGAISKTVYKYTLAVWMIFSVVQPTLSFFFPVLKVSGHIDLIICQGYLGFFILGHYLKKYYMEMPPKYGGIMLVTGISSTGLLVLAEYFLSADNFQGYFYKTYLTPNVLLSVIGVFLLFQNIAWKKRKVVEEVSELSVGVFYIHMLVMTGCEYMGFSGADNLLVCELKSIVVYCVSLFIAYCISKIRGINRLLLGIN